jgi:hypothetical protein
MALGVCVAYGQPRPTANGGATERVELKVLKVYGADEGGYRSRQYVVEWNGQEVLAEDPLVRTNAHTDDTITVLVMHSPFPNGRESYGLLHFAVVPSRPKKNTEAPTAGLSTNTVVESVAPQRVSLKVLRVYSAQDEGCQFRAYVVEWAGHEIVVDDRLVHGRYEVGDLMPTLVMKLAFPQGAEPYGLLRLAAEPRQSASLFRR